MATHGKIDFAAFHTPLVASGTYRVEGWQDVHSDDAAIAPLQFVVPTHHLFVAGPRFGLAPQSIAGVYPPPGSLGDHSGDLPHVLLRPSIIPWQRHVTERRQGDPGPVRDRITATPWLALLLFDADETPAPVNRTLAELMADAAAPSPPAAFPVLALEPADLADDVVTAIDVPSSTLRRLLPAVEELALLAHVREQSDAAGTVDALAVVLGNRLPPPTRPVTVHLISLEHRVERASDGRWRYDFHDVADAAAVRLVSLFHWSFTSMSADRSFAGLVAGLDRTPPVLRLPAEQGLRGRVSTDEAGVVLVTSEVGEHPEFVPPPQLTVAQDGAFGPALRGGGGWDGAVRLERPLSDRSPFTIALWAKPSERRPDTSRSLFGGADPEAGMPTMWQPQGTGHLAFRRGAAGPDQHLGMFREVFTDDRWRHLAWVKTADQERFFLDGQLLMAVDIAHPLLAGGADLWIGHGATGGGGTGWTGLLADARLYSRALSDGEVAALLDAERTHHPELAAPFTSLGLVPLEHHLRHGARTISWYGGPLRPMASATASRGRRPVHADGYVDYHAEVNMLDVSHAAAWELGRNLLLRDRSIALDLYRWQRSARHDAHRDMLAGRADHLPFARRRTEGDAKDDVEGAVADEAPQGEDGLIDVPDTVLRWLQALTRLENVPINYLLADPALLPPESLRFFEIDGGWIEALIDGALTIGAQTSTARSGAPRAAEIRGLRLPARGGLLVRSELVTGWPTLVVDGYADRPTALDVPGAEPLDLVRRAEIAEGILLCLFDGSPATVDVHLAATEVHCGFDPPGPGQTGFRKKIRTIDGHQTDQEVAPIPLRAVKAPVVGGVLNVGELTAMLGHAVGQPLTVADLALQLMQGVARVRFQRDEPAAF